MQFALIENVRTSPSPGLTAACPACGAAMIAKCGRQRVHHWAHRGERACDAWYEPETPWHRDWKNRFPTVLQEVVLHAASGEKHIADVRTGQGLTIEFQHSHLRPDERAAREQFYGHMFWVVDGARLKRDLPRFIEGFRSFRTFRKTFYLTHFPEEAFPAGWLNCRAPVFFDFSNAIGPAHEAMHGLRLLWCLLPGRVGGHAVMLPVSREDFVLWAHSEQHPIQPRNILTNVAQILADEQRRAQAAQSAMALRQYPGWQRNRYRRRTARF